MITSGIKHNKKGLSTPIIAIIVIIVIAVAAVGIYILANEKEATIIYTVAITPSEEVDLFVYIDGEEVFKERLEDDGSYERTRTHFYPLPDEDSKIVNIKAVAYSMSGKQLQSVSESIEIFVDEITEVTLKFQGGAAEIGYNVSLTTQQTVDIFVSMNNRHLISYPDETGYCYVSSESTYYVTGEYDDVPFKVEVKDKSGAVLVTETKTIRISPGEHKVASFALGNIDEVDELQLFI